MTEDGQESGAHKINAAVSTGNIQNIIKTDVNDTAVHKYKLKGTT
jgi:hypothetical protein